MALVRVKMLQQTAGEEHDEFQSGNKLSLVQSYIEELVLGPDLVHSLHEQQRGNWSRSPIRRVLFGKGNRSYKSLQKTKTKGLVRIIYFGTFSFVL